MISSIAAGPAPGEPAQPELSYIPAINALSLIRESVGAALLRVASAHPDRSALTWLTPSGTATMTWAELLRRASDAASDLGVIPPGGRVLLAAPNSAEWVIAMYGCALAGLSVVPISPWSTEQETIHILDHTRVAMILTAEYAGGHPVASVMRRAAQRSSVRPAVRSVAHWPTIEPATEPVTIGQFPCPEDEFLVQHTSGTSGEPKAVSLTHLGVLNCARVFALGADARDGDIWLNPLPVYHVGGFVSGVLSCLAIGGTYVVVEKFSPRGMLRVLREIRPAVVGLVPTMMIDLLAEPTISDDDFGSVRTVIGGATDIDPGLVNEIEQRLGILFMVGYGQSESPCMAMSLPSDPTDIRTRTLGHPLPGRDYYIAGPSGAVTPVGHVGELCVRGPLNMSGYLAADGEVDRTAGDMAWRATGDLCSVDENAVLRFHGRLRDIILRGGTTIYPAEVEHAISAHRQIAEVAVFGIPDRRLGETVAAAVIAVAGAQIDTADLTAFAHERLSVQKCPTEWFVVDDFPRTSTGKVRKHLLRQHYCR